jgi:hypothetical protein
MKVFDDYVWRARVLVGVVVALPTLIVSPWIGQSIGLGLNAAITSSAIGSAVAVLVALIVRDLGVAAEKRLVTIWGGYPSTTMLRWRDATKSDAYKARVHLLIKEKLGIALLTREEEALSPEKADQLIADAFGLVRRRIWGKSNLPTHADNKDYGFARNLYGVRWIWVGVVAGTIAFAAFQAIRGPVAPALVRATIGVAMLFGIVLLEWGVVKHHVKHCADRYAEHAWDTLDQI